ncbi:hypothetical protein ACIBF6_44590 [Streptosporangium amethystogenes]|uniref:hypothetical protein n=1 Tax=Streptosporangium amethystogenes TaxID=2002 RepID=UPI00378B444A
MSHGDPHPPVAGRPSCPAIELQGIDVAYDSNFELLQQVEQHFLEKTGNTKGSPYLFGLVSTDKPEDSE